MKTIKYTPEPNKKLQLSEAQEARLASLSDEDIDYSDIEELDDEFWEKAEIVSLDLTQSTLLRVRSPQQFQILLRYFTPLHLFIPLFHV